MSQIKVFGKPESLTEIKSHYCPGCHHGIIHRLVAESLDELDIRERTIGIAPVGCSVFAYRYFNVDMVQAAHGRAPAVATGIKRVRPESIVFTYQGDGDLTAIGMAEAIHSAARRENITVFMVNNAVYGMTSGQMSPTTICGQITTTSPKGRNVKDHGFPIKMSELLNALDGPVYIARVSVHNPAAIIRAKKAIKTALDCQVKNLGFSFVEILSSCPSSWGLSPTESSKWLEEHLLPVYPITELRKPEEVQ